MNNIRISPHVTLFEATHTNNASLLGRNREAGLLVFPKLVAVSYALIEPIRHFVLEDDPIELHSFLRCLKLNGAIKGSSSRSQHPKAEAFDWSPWGKEARDYCYSFFLKTRNFFVAHKIMFGQLIFEEIDRGYSKAHWIHTSMGAPFRDLNRCGEVLTMKNGKFELIEKVDVARFWR